MTSSIPLNKQQRLRAARIGAGMVLFDREGAGQCFKAALTGQWEGYEVDRFRERPAKFLGSLDSSLNYGVRESLVSEARSLEQTFPLAKRIRKTYSRYVIGSCRIRWNTGDPAIDKIYQQIWENWMNLCDYKGKHRFPKLMSLAVGNCFGDGDVFVQMIDSNGILQLNLIEADRVSSAGVFNYDSYTDAGPNMIGGIGLDPGTGRHKFIRVWQRTIYGTFVNPVEIAKPDYLHYFNPERIDSERGVTGYYCVLNTLRDLKEISDAQRNKSKINSKLALLRKVVGGQAPKINLGFGSPKQEGTSGPIVQALGTGAISYMFPNEDVTIHQGNDPGEAWQKHVDFLVRNIALGADLPYGVVWDMAGLGKPGILTELRQAERTISGEQDQVEDRLIRPSASVVISKAIKNGTAPFHPLWYKFKVNRPPFISIDAGRDSAAAINENKMGMRSLASWYEESGEYWRDEVDQQIEEEVYLQKQCKDKKVDPNRIKMLNNNPSGQQSQSGGDDKQIAGTGSMSND